MSFLSDIYCERLEYWMALNMSGLAVVNATPMRADGSVNEDVYVEHVKWLVESGVSYVVPAAATGEIMTLTEAERQRLVALAVQTLSGKGRVVAYAGRGSTRETVAAMRQAHEDGAHAAYIVQPWFCKPDQNGLYAHFKAAAEASDGLPLIIYNNPDRTSCSITHDTMARILDTLPAYQGIKDADHSSLLETFGRFIERIPVWPRSEREMLWALASGGNGVLSFSGNYLPRELSGIISTWKSGEVEAARKEYLRVYPLMRAVFSQPIPATVKFALNAIGFDFGDPRLPILPIVDSERQAVTTLTADLGIRR